jgi:SWI/SNF-related matrix-associated actin-dependent regulator 1 of chromatin subfamily A
VTIQLDPHQLKSVTWLKNLPDGRGGLADEPRVGKTYPAIVAAREVGAKQIAVLCPAMARGMWWAAIQEVCGKGKFALWPKSVNQMTTPDGMTWWVESYEMVATRKTLIHDMVDWSPDTVILDEFHFLKSRTAKRTKAIYGPQCETFAFTSPDRVWLLSGTPMPNNPAELWTHWRAIFREEMSYHRWLYRYCKVIPTIYGLSIHGVVPETLPELQAKFKARFLRRTFAKVHGKGKEPLVWRPVLLGSGKLPPPIAREERQMTALREALQNGGEPGEVELSTLRRLTGALKAPLTARYVEEYLEDNPGQKVLVLGVHRDSLTYVAHRLKAPLLIGGLTDARREEIRLLFHGTNPGSPRVLVGNIEACQVAIDLSPADVVVMMERVWTPGVNIQAAMRVAHRNKKGPTPVDVLGLAGSIDEAVARVDARKLQMLTTTLDQERT